MISLWTKFRKSLRAFCVAQRGNVAITFVLASLPVITGVGFAVDYSHANAVKVALQSALDSTALMLSKEAATDTSTQLSTNARNYFLALFTRPEATNVVVTANYDPNSATSLVVSASADVPTYLLGLLPGQAFQTLPVTASSTAKWGENRLRVALVLDNTGSMADSGKMTALISATKSLLTQLQGVASKNGDVYVSIIPFVKDVNLGAGNYASNYIYWGTSAQDPPNCSGQQCDNTSWDALNGQCEDQGGTVLGTSSSFKPRSSCVTKPSCSISGNITQTACTNAGSCSVSGFTSQSTCTGAGNCSLSGFTSQSTCTAAGTCSVSGHNSQSTCTAAGTCSISGNNSQSSCTSAGTCSTSGSTQSKCTKNHGTWTPGKWTGATWTAATWTATPGTWTAGIWSTATTKWVPNNHSTWTGCVMDRGYPMSPSKLSGLSGPDLTYNFDTNVSPPDLVTPRMSSLYVAEQYSSCPQAAVMGLNYDWASMTSLVNSMSPNGSTNQGLGLQLGWLSLVGGGPFTMPPLEAGYNYTQVIILLTDGLNTQDRWYGDGSSLGTSDDAKIDAREQSTCANFKAASISNPTNVIYTIQVNTGGDPTSTLLQGCASSPDKFYLLTSSSQILNVFTKIGNDLTQLRVAK
jgi:Flp pilus assembly protein TadG